MLIIHNFEPFDHVIIRDILDQDLQYQEMIEELIFLRPRMRGPESTGASNNKQNPNDYNKRGVGIFLNDIYRDISSSSIFFYTRKIFGDPAIKERLMGIGGKYFSQWDPENMQDSIIAQYYDHGDYYRPHTDSSLFSAVTVFYQTPREFEGGRFKFPEFDYSLDIEDNTTIIFPSNLLHEVEPLSIKKSGRMLGRFSVTNFISRRDQNRREHQPNRM